MGPYSSLPSSSRLTWSTPESSRLRHCSPSQVSASPWLPNVSFGRLRELAWEPSAFSNCHVQVIRPLCQGGREWPPNSSFRAAADRRHRYVPGMCERAFGSFYLHVCAGQPAFYEYLLSSMS